MEKKFQQFQSERRPPTSRTRVALWIRLAAVLALAAAVFMLYRLPGGFPPPTWLRMVALVRGHQLTPGPALFITAGQALALLVAWVLLVPVALHVVRLWRFDPRELLAQPPQAVGQTARGEEKEKPNGGADLAAAAVLTGDGADRWPQNPPPVNTTAEGARPPVAPVEASSRAQVTSTPPKGGAPGLDRLALTLITATTGSAPASSTRLPLDGSPARPPLWWSQEQREGISLVVSTAACWPVGANGSQPGREASLFSAAGLAASPAAQVSHVCLQPRGLFVLSDGCAYRVAGDGGGSTGLEAVQGVAQALLPLLGGGPSTLEAEAVGRQMLDGILHANATLFRRLTQAEVGESALETTLAALLVLGTSAYVASVGNSRVYLFRASEGLVQITYDHAPRSGEGDADRQDEGAVAHADEQPAPAADLHDEVRAPQVGHTRLYRSLGKQEQVEPDLFTLQLAVGDLLLLCSEGLWGVVEPSTIAEVLRQAAAATGEGAHRACWALSQGALRGAGAAPPGLLVAQVVALRDGASSQGEAQGAQREGALSGR